MKKKNAFTLIELIAVITLLAVIVLVTVPVIINTLSNSEQKEYEDFKKLVINAAELYVERNRDLFPELDNVDGMVEIDTTTLIEEGYLKQDLINPINEISVSHYNVNIVVSQIGTLTYTVEEK